MAERLRIFVHIKAGALAFVLALLSFLGESVLFPSRIAVMVKFGSAVLHLALVMAVLGMFDLKLVNNISIMFTGAILADSVPVKLGLGLPVSGE